MESRPDRRGLISRCLPGMPMAIALTYLTIAWALFFLVDVRNAFGLQDMLAARIHIPVTWYYLFQEGGATEIGQWLFLSMITLTAGILAGHLLAAGRRRPALFWSLIGVAAALMLIEDAGNPRHYFSSLAVMIIPWGESSTIKTTVELVYYILLSSVPVYAVVRFWRYPFRSTVTTAFLLIGFSTYGVAGFASATRHVMEWYAAFGHSLHQLIAGGQLIIPAGWDQYMLNFYLVDWLLEESLELIGAAALLTATLFYLQEYLSHPEMADLPDQHNSEAS